MKIKLSALFFITVIICGASSCDAVKHLGKRMLRGYVNPEKVATGLPIMKIDTKNNKPIVGKEEYTTADIEIVDPDNIIRNIKTTAEIRGRGNSSWGTGKNPYRIRFFEKTSLFGYEKARSWVLLANYWDITLLANSVAFELGRRMDIPFTPHYTHVELVLNGRYEGSYVITEQIQVGRGRVEIDEKTGFLVELDAHYDKGPKFRTPVLELPVMIKHPENFDEEAGYDFVKDAVNELEAALFSDLFPDTNYRDLIDLDNFIDVIMVNEITRNEDFQTPQSVYLYREGKKDARLRLGPLWDFDDGFGYDDGRLFGLGYDFGRFFNDTAGMFYNSAFRGGPGKPFFDRFFEDPYFRAKYRERWNDHYKVIADMETFIDQMGTFLGKSQEANHRVWRWRRGAPKEETERMKTWWRGRIEYLNKEINGF
jgi:hypothetical protein